MYRFYLVKRHFLFSLVLVCLVISGLAGTILYNDMNNRAKAAIANDIDNPPTSIYNDAYKYENGFDTASGYDTNQTTGFNHFGGYLQATSQTSTVTSECFQLIQPTTGNFERWLFMDMRVYDLQNTTSNILKIQDCSGNDLKTFNDLTQGTNSFDLRDIDPSNTNIQLTWEVNHNNIPGSGGIIGAKIDWWKVNGESSGVTKLSVKPQQTQIQQNRVVIFDLNVSSDGAVTKNSKIAISMDDVNGWNTPNIDDGLAEDAENDYGYGVNANTPIYYHNASNIPGAVFANNTTNASRVGEFYWSLPELYDGNTSSTTFELRPGDGYVNNKTFAVAPYIEFGEVPANDLGFDARMRIQVQSEKINVYVDSTTFFYGYTHEFFRGSDMFYDGVLDSGGPKFSPNDIDLGVRFEIRNSPVIDPSTHIENVTTTVKLYEGDCTPIYRGFGRDSGGNVLDLRTEQYMQVPPIGSPADIPIIIHHPRLATVHQNFRTLFDIAGSDCLPGDTIEYSVHATGDSPYFWESYYEIDGQIEIEARRTMSVLPFRVSYKDSLSNDYFPNDYEIVARNGYGNMQAGEHYLVRFSEGVKQNVTLDKSYNLLNIQPGLSFHGLRGDSYLSSAYKTCQGEGLNPSNPSFDHNDPTNSGWYTIDTNWSGSPWNEYTGDWNLDKNNPDAVVTENCQLLFVKHLDNPVNIGPDYGEWTIDTLMQLCNNTYCNEAPDETSFRMDGKVYTYYDSQVFGPFNYRTHLKSIPLLIV